MALDPISWAMKDAPVADVEEWVVLTCMAESAEVGCNAFQATITIATHAKVARRTVQRRIDALVKRSLIQLCDQQYEKPLKIPPHPRPTNYDLCIPYDWFGSIARVNDFRQRQGCPPFVPDDRPLLGRRRKRSAARTLVYPRARCKGPRRWRGEPTAERGDYKSPPDYGTRLPEPFRHRRHEGMGPCLRPHVEDGYREHERFCDYWRSVRDQARKESEGSLPGATGCVEPATTRPPSVGPRWTRSGHARTRRVRTWVPRSTFSASTTTGRIRL